MTTPHPRPNLGGETAGSSDPGTQEKGPAAVRDLLTVAPLAVALLVAAILAPYIGALAAVVGVGQ